MHQLETQPDTVLKQMLQTIRYGFAGGYAASINIS
jgi:hypothetical protein